MADRRARQASGGFAARLRQVIDAQGSANAVAKAIERSEGAVRKWLRGESEPNVTDLRTLSERTQTRIEWLVSGIGPREQLQMALHETPAPPYRNRGDSPLSYALLERILLAVDAEVCQDDLQLSPLKRAMLVVALYDLFQADEVIDQEAVARLVKLAR